VPAEPCAYLEEKAYQDAQHFTWTEDSSTADVLLSTEPFPGSQPAGTWIYAAAVPFYTLEDAVSSAELQATWAGGTVSGTVRPLLVTSDTLRGLVSLWGPPTAGSVYEVAPSALLSEAIRLDGRAILPFHQLEPRWKTLRVDGLSPLERGLDVSAYPLAIPTYLGSNSRPDALPLLVPEPASFSNRDEEGMAVVMMTGVTALTRGTGQLMNTRGTHFPAQDIGDWLRAADLTHISNEVSFTPECPASLPSGTMVFCSSEHYIELLEAVGTDIVELTGNHNNDYGIEPNLHTLEMFRERGWGWFGGGANLTDATRPLTVTLGPNRLAFLGCNAVGPEYGFATADRPGAAPCDWEGMQAQVRALRAEGWLPIFTVQAYETYEYFPTPGQVTAFQAMAEAGAVIVQGSQAHQPQGFEFHDGAFIHYGLGNLFFDQMWSLGTRQEFIDRHVFYDGRHIGVELLTVILEDYGRPRPMTAEERQELLESTFGVSEW
jgi:poly-gamma-glutamate synthesis protein (capsule biosynthesis protein)